MQLSGPSSVGKIGPWIKMVFGPLEKVVFGPLGKLFFGPLEKLVFGAFDKVVFGPLERVALLSMWKSGILPIVLGPLHLNDAWLY